MTRMITNQLLYQLSYRGRLVFMRVLGVFRPRPQVRKWDKWGPLRTVGCTDSRKTPAGCSTGVHPPQPFGNPEEFAPPQLSGNPGRLGARPLSRCGEVV